MGLYIPKLHPLYKYRDLLEELETRPHQRAYLQDVGSWLLYLERVERQRFRVSTTDEDPRVLLEFEYPHRWRDRYRSMTMAKLYRLEDQIEEKITPMTLMSLTTYQDGDYSRKRMGGYTIPQSFEVLADRRRALLKCITTRIVPGLDYLWVVEPHKGNDSGYPHSHAMFPRLFTLEEQQRIRDLWSRKYRVGSSERGIDFSYRESQGDIRSIRNYMMAYMGKSMHPATLTPGETVYHAIAWKHHYRFFGASRGYSSLMKPEASNSDALAGLTVEIIDEWGDARKPGHPMKMGGKWWINGQSELMKDWKVATE